MIKYTKEILEKLIKESFSVAEVLSKLGLKPAGGNYKTIALKVKDWDIDTSHFTGQGWNSGERFKSFCKKFTLSQILVENSKYTSTDRLRKRLISEGLKLHKCELCFNTHWNNKLIPLEIHHVNGVNTDHRLCNLQLLCPNCHASTNNYRGKNIKQK